MAHNLRKDLPRGFPMCGRFVQYSNPEVYASRFELDTLCEARPRYNIAPTQPVLVVRQTENGKRELVPVRWGLIPFWSKGPDSRYSMINARAETLRTKPAFRRHRCILPTEGFYEWKQTRGGKLPYLIHRRDKAPFSMAGVWESWRDPEGETLESCTIIVTAANSLVKPLHDRMPAILEPKDIALWLHPENAETVALTALLQPAAEDGWTFSPVSKQVNDPRNDRPELLKPPETEHA